MQKDLAPIVLFIYNRPEHTLKTLEALQKNDLASESILFVFADGPKEYASKEDLLKIKAARDVVKSGNWCKEVRLVESQQNKGLADSIITGVTKVVNVYGKVIVLEDDLISSVGFLRYMNKALKLYEEDENVMHVAAHIFETDFNLPETFFYNSASCWGWGTWSRAWKYLNIDAKQLLEKLKKHPNYFMFDLGRGYLDQLEGNIKGLINTWAIKWNANVFLNDGLCLHPCKTLTNNIGVGGDATNTISMDSRIVNQKMTEYINVERIALTENKTIYRALANYYKKSLWGNLKEKIRPFLQTKHIKNKVKNILKHYGEWTAQSPSTRNWALIRYQIKKKNIIRYLFNSNFDSSFYKEHQGLRNGYNEIAKIIIDFTRIKTACDFGCGNGYVISYLKNNEIKVLGLDGSEDVLSIADKNIVDNIKIADFRILQDFGTYDLVLSMEVAEHLKNKHSKVFIKNLIKHSTKYIIFSAALPGQWGDGHVNCRPREFWIKIFQEYGWEYDLVATEAFADVIHNNKIITEHLPWLINNFSLFKISKDITYYGPAL